MTIIILLPLPVLLPVLQSLPLPHLLALCLLLLAAGEIFGDKYIFGEGSLNICCMQVKIQVGAPQRIEMDTNNVQD